MPSYVRKSNYSLLNSCSRCPNNCCTWGGPVITCNEKDKIVEAVHESAFEPVGRFFRIRSKRSSECFYFQDGLCSIEQVKPLGCKTFPVTKYYDSKEEIIKPGICTRCPVSTKVSFSFKTLALSDLDSISDEQAVLWTDQTKYPIAELT